MMHTFCGETCAEDAVDVTPEISLVVLDGSGVGESAKSFSGATL